MTRMSVPERDALHSVERACGLDLESRRLRTEIVGRLARLVGYDAYCFATVDPWTLLLGDEVSAGIPPGGASVATHNEYLVEDVDKFADLVRSRRSVGILGHSTGGEPDRSHRFRTVLPLIEAHDEMRVVFVADRRCWGALSLFRGHARHGFTSREARLVRAVARPIATALRGAARRPGTSPAALADLPGPGVLLLDQRDEMTGCNETAQQWMDELSPHRVALHEVAAATRAGRAAKSYLRFRSRTGRWLSLWGSTVNDGGVSIVIQPTPTSDVARILTLAYALSPREQQVMQGVIAGAQTSVIATDLQVSAHTVQSHLKSLFAKAGVASRGQLVAKVAGEIYGI
jgi:DNA-binding CsgD family transcriptional regulator